MAQHLMSAAEAWTLLINSMEPLPQVELPLARSLGHWLARPLLADGDIPAARRSAMDGFALRSDDTRNIPCRLQVIAEVAAGSPDDPALAAGQCVRIFTGANLPGDADAVVPVEATSSQSFRDNPDDPIIQLSQSVSPGSHVIPAGIVATAGAELLAAGIRLGPRQIAVAAAAGQAEVSVLGLPRVTILNTGEELLEAGQPTASHQTRNSTGPFLEAALAAAGFPGSPRKLVPDNAELTEQALRQAVASSDAVIVTGGISAGRLDHVPGALAALGAEIFIKGVALKPGKPQVFSRTPEGCFIFGLPGNPLSSLVGFYEFVLPALRRLSGCPVNHCRPTQQVALAEPVSHQGGRMLVLPVDLQTESDRLLAVPRHPAGSGDMLTGGLADGAVLIPPAAGTVTAGTVVTYRPWNQGWSV